MQSIRSKIVGDADTVLELYGTPPEWQSIKANLLTHYNDKRDEVSLTRDLFKLTQIGTVEELYGKVSHIISLLVNKLNLNETRADVKSAKREFYQELGLKVFVAGLKEPLGPIIRAQAPSSMREALRLCSEESNYNYVRNAFRQHTPPIPPKPQYQTAHKPQFKFPQHPQMSNQQPFQPKPFIFNSNNPFKKNPNPNPFPQPKPFMFNPNNPFRKYSNPNPFTPYRHPPPNQNAFAPRFSPQPKPVPMEVDPSIRSHRVNYMNRPRAINYHEQAQSYYYPDYYLDENGTEMEYAEYVYPANHYQAPADNAHEPVADMQPALEEGQRNNPPEDGPVDDLNFQIVTDSKGMT